VVTPEEKGEAADTAKDLLTRNSLALEAQIEQRPLAKKQEEFEEAQAKLSGPAPPETQSVQEEGRQNLGPQKAMHKALLKNDDTELERLSKVLDLLYGVLNA